MLLTLLNATTLFPVQALHYSRTGSPPLHSEASSDRSRNDNSDSSGEEERILSAIAQVHEADIDASAANSRSLSSYAVPRHQSANMPRTAERRKAQIRNKKSQNVRSSYSAASMVQKNKKITKTEVPSMRGMTPPSAENGTKGRRRAAASCGSTVHNIPSHDDVSLLEGKAPGRSPKIQQQRLTPQPDIGNKVLKPSSTTTPWIRKFLSERPKDGKSLLWSCALELIDWHQQFYKFYCRFRKNIYQTDSISRS